MSDLQVLSNARGNSISFSEVEITFSLCVYIVHKNNPAKNLTKIVRVGMIIPSLTVLESKNPPNTLQLNVLA
ncbi:hypothetical protein, partial [Filifactor villosus]